MEASLNLLPEFSTISDTVRVEHGVDRKREGEISKIRDTLRDYLRSPADDRRVDGSDIDASSSYSPDSLASTAESDIANTDHDSDHISRYVPSDIDSDIGQVPGSALPALLEKSPQVATSNYAEIPPKRNKKALPPKRYTLGWYKSRLSSATIPALDYVIDNLSLVVSASAGQKVSKADRVEALIAWVCVPTRVTT